MGRKIFVSYKYADALVQPLPGLLRTTARHYVDHLQAYLDADDHINKGEQDGQSLRDFADATIASRLRDKIYDSSLTIVLASKGMRSLGPESDQWMPWEISYSLRSKTRDGRTSGPNALIALVLPDEAGSYSHVIVDDSCPHCHCRTVLAENTFGILARNTFNAKAPRYLECARHEGGGRVFQGDHSYVQFVKWRDFMGGSETYLQNAYIAQDAIDSYNIAVNVG